MQRLRAAAGDRPVEVPLLQRPDGRAWQVYIEGGWRICVRPAGAGLGWDPNAPYVWEVDAVGYEGLLPLVGYTRGTLWTTVVDRELARLRHIGSPLLENLEQLYEYLGVHVERITGAPPTDMKRFRRRIRDFLEVQK